MQLSFSTLSTCCTFCCVTGFLKCGHALITIECHHVFANKLGRSPSNSLVVFLFAFICSDSHKCLFVVCPLSLMSSAGFM